MSQRLSENGWTYNIVRHGAGRDEEWDLQESRGMLYGEIEVDGGIVDRAEVHQGM